MSVVADREPSAQRGATVGDCVVFTRVSGVSATVSASGQLELFPPLGIPIRCEGIYVAIWIALMQSGGWFEDAARRLVDTCGLEPGDLRVLMLTWVHELCSVGVLRSETPSSPCAGVGEGDVGELDT
jgi:hypothetical protein